MAIERGINTKASLGQLSRRLARSLNALPHTLVQRRQRLKLHNAWRCNHHQSTQHRKILGRRAPPDAQTHDREVFMVLLKRHSSNPIDGLNVSPWGIA